MLKKLWNSKSTIFILWITVTMVAPVALIMWRYDFLKMTTGKQIGFPVLIVLLWALIRFWSSISEAIETMKEGFTREILRAVTRLGPYILLFTIGFGIKMLYKEFLFISTVLLLTQALGVILEARHSQLKRKELMKRGYVNVLK